MHRHFSVAVLIDVENLIKGYAVATGVIRTVPLKGILEEVRRRLPQEQIGVVRAYANWSNARLGVLREALNELGIQPVQVFGFGSFATKNAADLQLAIDAVELAFTKPTLTAFVIVSGDGGFAALAGKLHELGRAVIGASYEHAASPIFQAVCDEFILIPTPDGLESVSRESGSESKETDGSSVEVLPLPNIIPGLLDVPAYRNATAAGGLALTGLHSYVLALLPDFQLPLYGFEKFIQFACAVCEGTELTVARDPAQNVVLIRRDRLAAGWQAVDSQERSTTVAAELRLSDAHIADRQDVLSTRWPVWPVPAETAPLIGWLQHQPDLQMTPAALVRAAGHALPDSSEAGLRRALNWLQAGGSVRTTAVDAAGPQPICRLSRAAAAEGAAAALLRGFLLLRLSDIVPGQPESVTNQLITSLLPAELQLDDGSSLIDLDAGYRELGLEAARAGGNFAALLRLPGQLRDAAQQAERVAQLIAQHGNGGIALADWRQANHLEFWQRLSNEPQDWQLLAVAYRETADHVVALQQFGIVMRQFAGSNVPARVLELGSQLVQLAAEGQSALRVMLERIVNNEEQRNLLQKAVFSWLKDYAREQRVHIQRFMRLTDRADPTLAAERLRQSRRLSLELFLRLRNERLMTQLFGRLALLVTGFDEDDLQTWFAVEDTLEQLILLGTPPNDERLLNLLGVIREALFAAEELTAAVEAVRAALAQRSALP